MTFAPPVHPAVQPHIDNLKGLYGPEADIEQHWVKPDVCYLWVWATNEHGEPMRIDARTVRIEDGPYSMWKDARV